MSTVFLVGVSVSRGMGGRGGGSNSVGGAGVACARGCKDMAV